MFCLPVITITLLFTQTFRAAYSFKACNTALHARQASSNPASLQVDLGYEIYEGVANASTGLNVWKGIRYAAPPTGSLRWQAPQAPIVNRSSVVSAGQFGAICPQNPDALGAIVSESTVGVSEDCLFLNVYAPKNATGPLPVMVWIHGGGYGTGSSVEYDLSSMINVNEGMFLGVTIQYRLGAFGFLSSDEVFRNGVVNAGLLDQHFALQWTQSYIGLFGGNSSQVTIAGESAGGGSVMLQDMAYGGSLGDQLFSGTVAASPYLPMQYGYKDWIPSQSYYAFAREAGCPDTSAYGHASQTIFQCLVGKSTDTLINASATISQSGTYGTWGFLPVIDGIFIEQTPSQQLLKKQVNGRNALLGNNAEEGTIFVPQIITTEADLVAWLLRTFPLFTNDDIAKILLWYPSSNASDTTSPLFATTGDSVPTAINQSASGVGQQQRANNIYAETTFVCPSYWMAEAYSDKDRTSFKYQYSVPIALHGSDVAGYFGAPRPNQSPDFQIAFQKIWGAFIVSSNPSITNEIASGASSNMSSAQNPSTAWPQFSIYSPYQINLNQTGGVPTLVEVEPGVKLTEDVGPGLRNDFTLVNAYTWEGGRGYRCDFWRSIAALVPE